MKEKLINLKKEIDKYKEEYGEKRREYEKRVVVCNILMAWLIPLASVMLILSYIFTNIADVWKGLALALCLFSNLLTHWAKNNNYGAKLIQRGITYFSLCNLSREINDSLNPEEQYEKFAKKFEEIMEKDNAMSLSNSREIVEVMKQDYTKSREMEKKLLEKINDEK